MNSLFTDDILMRSLTLFLLLGSIAGLLAGAALLFRPDWLSRVSQHANRWVSTRQMSRPLARAINLDRWFYRYKWLSGGLLMSGAIYIVYFFTAVFDSAKASSSLFSPAFVHPQLAAGLIDGLVLICLTGAVFAGIVSLFFVFRPSQLREFEERANHHTSLRQRLKPLESQRNGLDQYVFQNVRLAGGLLLIGSLYTLVILLNTLGRI